MVRSGDKAKGLLATDTSTAPQLDLQTNERSSGPKLFWSQMHTAEAEAIRTLQAAVLASSTPAPQVFLVSSPSVGEGKTTVALNFACVLAQHGKTCLIEGDMRRPMIESALGTDSRTGLGEVLAGKKTVGDALIAVPGVPGLVLLPTGALPNSPSDLLASQNMRYALNSLREQFDHVVIDSPPLLCFSDASMLAALSDAVILVSRYGRTTRRAVQRSTELLAEVKAPLLGVVLNGVDLSSPDYHYFNYGYSWAASRQNYEQVYKPFVPASGDEKTDQKSRGAHA
jgi:capsular exopolysaccharide synthesis family protein